MINKDNYIKAREIIVDKLSFSQYFNDHIDSKVTVGATSLLMCPLHDERTPSMKYFEDTKTFYCFGCESSGTVLEMHHKYISRGVDGYSKVQALLDLSRSYEIEVPNIFERVTEVVFEEYKKPSLLEQPRYTETYLLNTINKELNHLLARGSISLSGYISSVNELDRLNLISDNLVADLENLREQIKGGNIK